MADLQETIEVSTANSDSLAMLSKIQRTVTEAFPGAPDLDLGSTFDVTDIEVFRASVGGAAVGLAVASRDLEIGIGYIDAVCVLPKFQSNGAGSKLLERAEVWLVGTGLIRLIEAVMPKGNLDAQNFFRRRGYDIDGVQASEVLPEGMVVLAKPTFGMVQSL